MRFRVSGSKSAASTHILAWPRIRDGLVVDQVGPGDCASRLPRRCRRRRDRLRELDGGFQLGDVAYDALSVLVELVAITGGQHAAAQPQEERRPDELLESLNSRRDHRLDRI